MSWPAPERRAKSFKEGRKVVFTLHNYTPEMETALQDWPRFSYLVYGHEVGKEQSPHLQVYAEMDNSVKLKTLQNIVGVKFHAEVPFGTAQRNFEYCTKEDPDTYFCKGKPKSNPGKRTDLAGVKSAVAAGSSMSDICAGPPLSYQGLRHAELLMKYTEPPVERTLEVIPCSGIDHVFSQIPKEAWGAVYSPITLDNWDGYDGHELVHICFSLIPFSNRISRFFRPYPFRVNVKGSSRQARYTKLYVTGWAHFTDAQQNFLGLKKDGVCRVSAPGQPCSWNY